MALVLLALGPGRALGAEAVPATLEHCVGGPAIVLGGPDTHALLDATDRAEVRSTMIERFPALQRSPFAPTQIMLWHKRADEWLFIALMPDREAPKRLCFIATFAAEGFEFTPALQQKYFFSSTLRT